MRSDRVEVLFSGIPTRLSSNHFQYARPTLGYRSPCGGVGGKMRAPWINDQSLYPSNRPSWLQAEFSTDFFNVHYAARISVLNASLDALADVDSIHDVIPGSSIGKRIDHAVGIGLYVIGLGV